MVKLTEDDVSFALLKALQKAGWQIYQYHAPGGQCDISLIGAFGRIAPDIIARRGKLVLVCENKGIFCLKDIEKLELARKDPDVELQLRNAVVGRLPINESDLIASDLVILWAHGYSTLKAPRALPAIFKDLIQIIVNPTDETQVAAFPTHAQNLLS